MNVGLRPLKATDLPQTHAWYVTVDARRFMSRWGPRCYDLQNVPDESICRWYVITVDGRDVGSVWLERDEPDVVRLGILIGDESLLGKGIGREAIRQAILETRRHLTFTKVRLRARQSNARALACYRACGFTPTFTETITNAQGVVLQVVVMEKALD